MSATHKNIKDILRDPAEAYDKPIDVVQDDSLSLEEKKEVLLSWEADVKALLRAEAENMPPPENVKTTGDKLALISKIRKDLEEE